MVLGLFIGAFTGTVGYGIRQIQANFIEAVTPPNYPDSLREAMGQPPSILSRPQVHHNLPWKFKDWFAGQRRGLNVNNPSFGRWVEGTPPGQHQIWSGEYNKAWEVFIQQYPRADKWQVLAQLNRLIASGKFP